MNPWRYLMATLIIGLTLFLAGCRGTVTDTGETVALEPVFGQPLAEEFPQYSQDPYAHIGRDQMEAAWQAWAPPDGYGVDVAGQVDPSRDHPHKVAYTALLA